MDWFGFANYIKTDSLYSATLNGATSNSTTSDSATLNIAVTTSASLKLCNMNFFHISTEEKEY